MKASPFSAAALILVGLVPLAGAQELAPAPTPLAVVPPVAPPVPLTVPPTAPLANLWNGENPTTLHVSGDIALGVYSSLGHNSVCPPMIGTSGTVNVFTPNFGVSVGASDYTSTRSGSWNSIRRP
jgi:hypothetical protein